MMLSFISRSRSLGRAILFGAALLAASGCDLLTNSDVNPEQIRVRVEGGAGSDLNIVLGDRFFLGGTGEEGGSITVTLISADTVAVDPPYDQSFDLAPSFQFYVLALADSLAAPQEIRIEVLVDGESRYDKSGTLGEEEFEFVYNFN